MKKRMIYLSCIALLLGACSSSDKTKEYGVTDTKSCDNALILEANKDDLIKDKGSIYCAVDENLSLRSGNRICESRLSGRTY